MLDLTNDRSACEIPEHGRPLVISRVVGARRQDKAFTSWWLAVLGIGVTLFYAFAIGAAQRVFMGDVTRITRPTAAVAVLATGVIGRALYDHRDAERAFEIGLCAEDACMRLGMFGTVVGCLIVFHADISSSDAGDASKTAFLIQKFSSAFGTAIGTTAVGVASSLAVKIQNAILQHAIDETSKSEHLRANFRFPTQQQPE